MPDSISEATTVKLKFAAWVTVAVTIWMAGAWAKGYLLTQEFTNRQNAESLQALKNIIERQGEDHGNEIRAIKEEIRAIRQYEARLVEVQSQISSTQAGVAGLDALVAKHVHLRWNIDMQQLFVEKLQQALTDHGMDIEMPDIQAIRAAVLFRD